MAPISQSIHSPCSAASFGVSPAREPSPSPSAYVVWAWRRAFSAQLRTITNSHGRTESGTGAPHERAVRVQQRLLDDFLSGLPVAGQDPARETQQLGPVRGDELCERIAVSPPAARSSRESSPFMSCVTRAEFKGCANRPADCPAFAGVGSRQCPANPQSPTNP